MNDIFSGFYIKNISLKNNIFILFFSVLFFSNTTLFSFAVTNGQSAIDIIGRGDDQATSTLINLPFSNGVPNSIGFSGPGDVVIDEINHRLFVTDISDDRVLIFNLDTNNNLLDYTADFVLGQNNFYENIYNTNGQARILGPSGMTYDNVRNLLYISNENRVSIFDVTSITNGENAVNILGQTDFTTVSSGLTDSKFYVPTGLFYQASSSYLFVVDRGNARVLVFDTNVITNGEAAINVLGQTDFITNTSGGGNDKFANAHSVTIDKNNLLYVSDTNLARVTVFDTNVITNGEAAINVLGQTDFTTYAVNTSSTGFRYPTGFSYASSTNRLFVSDAVNRRVLVFDVASITNGEAAINVLGQNDFTASSTVAAQNGALYSNTTAFNNDKLYVSDLLNNRVLIFDVASVTDGENAIDLIGQTNDTNTAVVYDKTGSYNSPNKITLRTPQKVEIDKINHRMFVSENNSGRVLIYNLDTNNNLSDHTADYVLGKDNFYSAYNSAVNSSNIVAPKGLAYDDINDKLYVVDSTSHRVLVFDVASITNGESAINVLGQNSFITSSANVTASGLNGPDGLAYENNTDRLFVSDAAANRIMIFDAVSVTDGEAAINVLGKTDFVGGTTAALSSSFNIPRGLSLDNLGRLAVADSNNNRVMIYDVNIIPVPRYSFVSSSVTISESVGTTTTIPITFSSSYATTTTVIIDIIGGTATSTVDYTFATGTLSNSSTTSFTFYLNINIIDDALAESSETIILNLNTPSSNSVLGTTRTFTINITDNDASGGGGGGSASVTTPQEQTIINSFIQNFTDTTIKKSTDIKDFLDKKIVITKENLENILSNSKAVSEIARARFAIDEEGNSVIGLDNCAPGIPLRATYNGRISPFKVKELQRFLNTEGNNIPVTGIFHTMTISAINKFQAKYNLEINGQWQAPEHNLASKLKCDWKSPEEILLGLSKNTNQNLSCKNNFSTTLRASSKNEIEIKKMQIFLAKELSLKPFEDNIFGIRTERAVKTFQKKYKLDVTGLWGKNTQSKANKLLCE